MKLRTLGFLSSVVVLALSGCEQEAEPVAEEKPIAEKPAEPPPPPKPESTAVTACNALVEAAKAKDEAKFMANATEGADALLGAKKETVMTMLGNATCAAESTPVEGKPDAAMVAVTTAGDQKRDVPFLKVGDEWKFDAQSYVEKYPMIQEKAKKGKKGKGAKRAKKAG